MTMEAQYAAQYAAHAATSMSGASPAWQANLARLEGLAEVLAHHGLRARLMTPPGGLPSLHVVARGTDGIWWFWWSWAERIAASEDLEGAAAMIRRVLAAT